MYIYTAVQDHISQQMKNHGDMVNAFSVITKTCLSHGTLALVPRVRQNVSYETSFMYRSFAYMICDITRKHIPGLPFNKWTDVVPQDLVKSRSLEIHVQTFPIALKICRHLGSSAAEMPVKYQRYTIIITSNIAAFRLHEIKGKTSCLVKRGP